MYRYQHGIQQHNKDDIFLLVVHIHDPLELGWLTASSLLQHLPSASSCCIPNLPNNGNTPQYSFTHNSSSLADTRAASLPI